VSLVCRESGTKDILYLIYLCRRVRTYYGNLSVTCVTCMQRSGTKDILNLIYLCRRGGTYLGVT